VWLCVPTFERNIMACKRESRNLSEEKCELVCMYRYVYVCFGLVWFGLVGFSFNASLGPQRRARKRGRLAEAALAHHALWDKGEYPENSRPDPMCMCMGGRRERGGEIVFCFFLAPHPAYLPQAIMRHKRPKRQGAYSAALLLHIRVNLPP
jgi:hypothetical protein